MIMIAGTLKVPTENMGAARSELGRLVEETRKEPGCVHFSFSENISEPGLLHLAEGWTNLSALEAHRQSPHMKGFGAIAQKLGVHDRNLVQYDIASHTEL